MFCVCVRGCVRACVCVGERFYSVSLGSPPRIALLTAGYKGLFFKLLLLKKKNHKEILRVWWLYSNFISNMD